MPEEAELGTALVVGLAIGSGFGWIVRAALTRATDACGRLAAFDAGVKYEANRRDREELQEQDWDWARN